MLFAVVLSQKKTAVANNQLHWLGLQRAQK
jgi:hypothetical protein